MHTAFQLNLAQFAVDVDDRATHVDVLLPAWHKHQRFGIVVQEPLGGVGASLLIQAVIAKFHSVLKQTWTDVVGVDLPGPRAPGTYPEVYVFNVGRRFGDMSIYDFWPHHKEVFVEANPSNVVQAINDRGITLLAVPEGDEREPDLEWPERRTFMWRTEAVFSYSASGRVPDADFTIRALDPATEENPAATLHPEPYFEAPGSLEEEVGGTLAEKHDTRRWRSYLIAREHEVTREERAVAISNRQDIVVNGLATESYRRRDAQYALRRLVP